MPDKLQKILLLAKGSRINPATRYRFLQYEPFWNEAGFEVDCQSLFDDDFYCLKRNLGGPSSYIQLAKKTGHYLSRRTKIIETADRYDLVLLENQAFPYEPGALDDRLLELNPKTILEFDDAIYLTFLHDRKLRSLLKKVRRVIVGNRYLAEFARHFSEKVTIVPTVIDTDAYPAQPKPRDRRIVIGWIGLPINLPNLDIVAQALAKLAEEFPIELRVISSTPHVFPHVPCSFVPWTEQGEIHALHDFDIGIMPLPDNEWSRGKCGAKVLQYMAAGRPAVATPVGVNADIIRDGETGFWASTPNDWYRSLRRLVADAELATKMGSAGRRKVERDYSLKVWGPRLMQIYQDVIDEP